MHRRRPLEAGRMGKNGGWTMWDPREIQAESTLVLLLLLHCVGRLKCLFVKMEMQQAAHTSSKTVAECLRQAYFGGYSGGVMNGLGSPPLLAAVSHGNTFFLG